MPRLSHPAVLAALVGAVGLVALVPGYADHGLWSHGEIPVLQRAQAALGAALSN